MAYIYERKRAHKVAYYCLTGVVVLCLIRICFFNSQRQVLTQKIVHVPKNVTTADHCVFYNFLSPPHIEETKHEPITLALHSTINYAYHLVKQAKDWNDVISYAVYLFPEHDAGLLSLAKLHKCHELINQKVSIHLVWNRLFKDEPCSNSFIMNTFKEVFENSETCDGFDLQQVKSELAEIVTPLATYPINVMRNEARRGAATKLHLIGDIETKYSPNFAVNVRPLAKQLLNGDLGKAVLVYRRFEMDENEIIPKNLQRFKELVDSKKIIQFHVEYFKIGHFIPNLDKWLRYSLKHEEIAYEEEKYSRAEWEPQFIMTHDTPYHYEHAPTRTLDHQFLCYELCRAGYSYLIMSHVYNIHLGIKQQLNALEMSVGMYGLTQKDRIMAKYAAYINGRYPVNENAKCPPWDHYI